MPNFFSLENPIFTIFIAALLGAFLGIRREIGFQKTKEKGFLGFRTQTLLSSMGALSTIFPTMPYLPVVFFLALVLFLGISHTHGTFQLNRLGITTEISAIFVFWIGVLIGLKQPEVAILLTVFLASINAYKKNLRNFVETLKMEEWTGALQLLIISGAILPFLPRETIDPWGVINPFNIWFLVILISGVGFLGYFLIKFWGAKGGIPITGFLGAIVSSTAVTTSMALQSKNSNRNGIFAVGILIAVGTMQIRVIAEIFFWGKGLLPHSIYVLPFVMALSSFGFAIYYLRMTTKNHASEKNLDISLKSPFQLLPALQFAFAFVVILVALEIAQKHLGNSGIYVTAFLSGFVDVDAIILSTLESLRLNNISSSAAQIAISIAIFVNTLIKIVYVYFLGSKKLTKKIMSSLIITSIISSLVLGIVLSF